ncbi:ABC transporter substrate-binding protein [Eggerthellaceae bacterium zg-1084]|uniref:ABC transporter substrate-binding protein n=1 Tax=Berryella wangjianweii TaxID=2734634 RepID=UPI0015531044|nr:ABC transporter substrate-binding protein [Berryella wangjianweii]NPD30544.1 ABC transporter substrate-binding protein [Berryella wangjianweii]
MREHVENARPFGARLRGKRGPWALCAAVLLAAVCLMSWGCTSTPSGSGAASDASPTDAKAVQFVDAAGVEHTFDRPVKKAAIQYSGSGGAFITMSALFGREVHEHISGMDPGLEQYRADMWKTFVAGVPELADIPRIGSVGKDFDLEGVIASDAEAVILPLDQRATASESVEPKLRAAGIAVVYIDFHDQTKEGHVKSVRNLGAMFGKQERAEQVVQFYLEHRERVEQRVNELLKTHERPLVYMEVAADGPGKFGNSYNNSYMWGAIAHEAGATSVGEGVLENYGQIDPERLLKADPQKIVLTGSYWPKSPESVRMGFEADPARARELASAYFQQRSGWDGLSAWKRTQSAGEGAGEVYLIHHGLARDVYDCASYEFLAQVCFPDELADLDPTATLRSFYEKFLPYEFSGLWFYRL